MRLVPRLALALVIAAVTALVAYGVGLSGRPGSGNAGLLDPSPVAASAQSPDAGSGSGSGTPSSTPTPAPTPTPTPTPAPTPTPTMTPGPVLLGPGDEGDDVRDLQARLKQIDWFEADVTGYYGDVTAEAVRGFQAKREIPVTGAVDRRTLERLHAMTTTPTPGELTNLGNVPGALDDRCATGRVLCIDKSSQTLRWVVDGQVLKTVDVRFGASYTPTREGTFSVYRMSRDHVSSLYGSSMPFAMFFSGGQAVHYSSDFAATGYAGASHGCVNVRDYAGVAWLFDRVHVGDTVVIYRS
ncbi:MAG: Peptidoglycan-binding domain 1 protein [Nocardioides sp.]|nr:Peptidoglycan-binding domain 1 protein [Nocardioides sp.]